MSTVLSVSDVKAMLLRHERGLQFFESSLNNAKKKIQQEIEANVMKLQEHTAKIEKAMTSVLEEGVEIRKKLIDDSKMMLDEIISKVNEMETNPELLNNHKLLEYKNFGESLDNNLFSSVDFSLTVKKPFDNLFKTLMNESFFFIGKPLTCMNITMRICKATQKEIEIQFESLIELDKSIWKNVNIIIFAHTYSVISSTFGDFLAKGDASFISDRLVHLKLVIPEQLENETDVIIAASSDGVFVKGSPVVVSIKYDTTPLASHESDVNEKHISGKVLLELYSYNRAGEKKKIIPATEIEDRDENDGDASRNVTFNHYVSMLECNHEADSPNRWSVRQIETKLEDGNLSLVRKRKTTTETEGSFAETSSEFDYSKHISITDDVSKHWGTETAWEGNVKLDHVQAENDEDDDESNEDDVVEPKVWKYEVNLSSPLLRLCHVKTFDCESVKSKTLFLPQSVSRDPYRDITYISDIGSNCIHAYKGWTYQGVWPDKSTTFKVPRYVLTVPHFYHPELNEKKGMRVLVMDNNGMHVFSSSGQKLRTLYNQNTPSAFRGLAFSDVDFMVYTTEKRDGEGVFLICLNAFTKDDKIYAQNFVKSSAMSPVDIEKSMCRFLTTHNDRIFISDLGLNCVHSFNLQNGESSILKPPGGFSRVTGLVVDGVGNLLVADTELGKSSKFHLFSQTGNYIRCLESYGVDVSSVTGMTLCGNYLYVADIVSKAVHVFTIAEGSPVKIAQGDVDKNLVVPFIDVI